MRKQNELVVAYSSDDNYAPFLGISMYSLLETNREFTSILVYVLDCGISQEEKEKLQTVARQFARTVTFIPMQASLDKLDLRLGAHKISVASYARLFLGSLLPEEVSQILYLDCDTIVKDSLAELWSTELGDALIAGVQDTVDEYFKKVIHLPKQNPYINAGVLLINLSAWRRERLQEQFLETVRQFGGNVPHHDQGCINAVCQGRRKLLPVRYNFFSNMYSFSAKTIRRIYFLDAFYTEAELQAGRVNPAIVHFTSGLVGRPWETGCTHPEQEAFWTVVKKTPWAALTVRPDSRRRGLKAFIWVHKVLPTTVFETVYRASCWLLHLRK